jgi:hypothetical protein
MWLLYVLLVIVAAAVLWKLRVPLLAKVLGQPKSRIERQLNQRRDR